MNMMVPSCLGGTPWIPGVGEHFMEFELENGSNMDWESIEEEHEELKLKDFMGKRTLFKTSHDLVIFKCYSIMLVLSVELSELELI